MQNEKANNNIFLISDDLTISTKRLYLAIANNLNKKLCTVKVNRHLLKFLLWPLSKTHLLEKISNSLIIDNTKIKKKLGWKPLISFDEEIKNMVDKYKQNNELAQQGL